MLLPRVFSASMKQLKVEQHTLVFTSLSVFRINISLLTFNSVFNQILIKCVYSILPTPGKTCLPDRKQSFLCVTDEKQEKKAKMEMRQTFLLVNFLLFLFVFSLISGFYW